MGNIISLLFTLVYLAFIAAVVVGAWKTFVKAGLPGWASIVPIYNLYLLWQMTGKPISWFILMFVPCVNIVFLILIMIEVAKAYGKGPGIGVLLVILGIGWLILGFGDAKYQGKPIQQGFPTPPPQ